MVYSMYSSSNEIEDGVLLGRTSTPPRIPIYVKQADFLRHCLIVGTTGSGKTSLAMKLANELKRYGASVVLDWYGEYSRVGDYIVDVGVGEPVAIPIEDPLDAVFLLEEVLDLSSPQAYLLAKLLKKPKDLERVIDLIETYEPEARWEVETKASLMRKVSLLLKYGKVFKVVQPSEVDRLVEFSKGRLTVFNLSNLKTLELRRLVALGVLNAVKYLKERGVFKDSVFVVVEEAHNVMAKSKFLQKYLAEVRKLGIGLIVVTQSPAGLDYEIMNNTNIKVVKALKSADDISAISKSMNLDAKVASLINKLGYNEAVVEAPSLIEPILIELT
ncbi:MAG: ATP-binding protein [Sulfolobales archaeon]